MNSTAHTPGPWFAKSDRRRYNPHFIESAKAHVADVMVCGIDKRNDPEAAANARLIAATPDHAMICWAMCIGAGRWEPWGDRRGEFCINGMRYSTEIDEFGCPIVTDSIRVAIAKAEGRAS